MQQQARFREEFRMDNRQWQELLVRNQRLAMEITRLQDLTRNMRKKMNSMMISKLHIEYPQKGLEKETQTELDINESLTGLSVNNSTVDIEKTVTPVRSHRKKTHSRTSSMHECQFDIYDDIPAPLPTEYGYITKPYEQAVEVPLTPRTPPHTQRRSFNMESENRTPLPNILSPSQERVAHKLANRVCSPDKHEKPESEDVGLFSPISERSGSTRPPRSARRPLSYQEPSLRAKVRKGYKAFK